MIGQHKVKSRWTQSPVGIDWRQNTRVTQIFIPMLRYWEHILLEVFYTLLIKSQWARLIKNKQMEFDFQDLNLFYRTWNSTWSPAAGAASAEDFQRALGPEKGVVSWAELGLRVHRPRQTVWPSLPRPRVWCQDKCYATIAGCMNAGNPSLSQLQKTSALSFGQKPKGFNLTTVCGTAAAHWLGLFCRAEGRRYKLLIWCCIHKLRSKFARTSVWLSLTTFSVLLLISELYFVTLWAWLLVGAAI